jgi:glycosyltransferase involved in cell wall biosynthesis
LFSSPGQPLPSTEPYIFSAGLEMRDYDTLIAAVKDLPIKVIIGAGSPWSKFRFDVENPGVLPENIQVSMFNSVQMRELYRSASMVVVPVKPTMRACGISVVLEAWAMVRPIIASKTMGLIDYIQDGETGLFVEPGNVEDLRSRILQLLANPQEASRLGENGYFWVRKEFFLEKYLLAVRSAILSTE